ncbi:MAG TPA: LLM class flavin-dependent oxidoreductase [Actinomycetota bacterium]|nr:LLM class flavin-dependent oxidoreductase [Actinomycetota bacterium]
MQVGVGLPNAVPGTSAATLMEWARRADEGPFTSVAVVDRVRYEGFDALTALAAAAAVTARVRLVTMVLIAPLRRAAVLAKEAATVHEVSGGRLVLGVGLGARRDDFEQVGVPYGGRARRFGATLETLRAAWEGEAAGPPVTRPPGPALLVGGASDAAFARAARYGDGYVHGGGPPRAFARAAEKARAAWFDAQRPGEPRLWGQGYFALGDAVDRGRAYMRDYYAFTGSFAERIAEQMLATPQAIVSFVKGYADAGCDEVVLFPAAPDVAQLDLLAAALDGL